MVTADRAYDSWHMRGGHEAERRRQPVFVAISPPLQPHRIQEKAYGGPSRSAQHLLDQMMKAYRFYVSSALLRGRKTEAG
jgi:hypothetical protein